METKGNIKKYANGKIYRVCDNAYNKFYYGSTTQTLSARMGGHRKLYRIYQTSEDKKYVTIYRIFDEFGHENCKIELVESFPCAGKEELQQREGYWIRKEDCVNKVIPGRTRTEYCTENREQILEAHKKYQKAHANRIKERTAKYYQDHKEAIDRRHKQYNEVNADTVKEWRRKWMKEYEKNTLRCRVCSYNL